MINFIKNTINNIADDKKDHVLLGMFVGYPLILIGYFVDIILDINVGFIVGGALGILIVGLKEIVHDGLLGKGKVELADFLYSALPIVPIMLTYLI